MTPEASFTAKCKKYIGGYWIRLSNQSTTGLPDYIVIHKRRPLFVEMKAPGKTARLSQMVAGKELSRKTGVPFIVINSDETADAAKRYLSQEE